MDENCDGKTWLTLWLDLESTRSEAARHTVRLFLESSIWNGKAHPKSELNSPYRRDFAFCLLDGKCCHCSLFLLLISLHSFSVISIQLLQALTWTENDYGSPGTLLVSISRQRLLRYPVPRWEQIRFFSMKKPLSSHLDHTMQTNLIDIHLKIFIIVRC